jgi:hypothetical protein
MIMHVSRILTVLLALFVVTAGVSGTAVAQSDDPAWADELFGQMQTMVEPYNERAGSLDLPIGNSLLENARITAEVSDDAGNTVYYRMETNDQKEITSLERGEHPDPTLKIVTTLSAMDDIASSQDPVGELATKIETGEVQLKGVGITNAVTTTIIDVLRFASGLFG